ncbi:hypothetical protein [Propionivibrio sp.]|uniref:hypothetical protein n=1 Tax=Propionivibrio sp. TaxID=2212460 RepID=UPI003BF44AAD
MKNQNEEPEVVVEAPAVESKLTLVVILAMLLGILLAVVAVGAFLYYQKSKDLQAEVVAVREALKEKGIALDEMKSQIEFLSKRVLPARVHDFS